MKKYFINITFYIFFPCVVCAQDTWYQVEMIVFENLYPETDGEFWYHTPELVDLNESLVLRKFYGQRMRTDRESTDNPVPNEILSPYTLLPEENYRLQGIYRVFRLSREYRPLFHQSWQQPGLDGDEAKPVHLQSEDISSLYELTIPAGLVTDPMPVNFYEPVRLIFDGTLTIRSSLYLYVDLDLVLFRQPPVVKNQPVTGMSDLKTTGQQTEQEVSQVEYVRLTESRRIKLNELHYFDHPLFGVIIQVSRFEPE